VCGSRAAPRASPAAAPPAESLDRVLRDAQRLLQAGAAGEALGAGLAPVRARAARLDGPDDAYRAHLLIGTRLAELCALATPPARLSPCACRLARHPHVWACRPVSASAAQHGAASLRAVHDACPCYSTVCPRTGCAKRARGSAVRQVLPNGMPERA